MSVVSADLAVVLPAERRDFGKDYTSLYSNAFCTLIWEVKMFSSRSFSVGASTQLCCAAAHPASPSWSHCKAVLCQLSVKSIMLIFSIVWMFCICQNLLLCFNISLFIAEGVTRGNSFCPHTRLLLKVLNIFHYIYYSISREGGRKSEISKCESKAWPEERVITVTLYQSSLQPKQGVYITSMGILFVLLLVPHSSAYVSLSYGLWNKNWAFLTAHTSCVPWGMLWGGGFKYLLWHMPKEFVICFSITKIHHLWVNEHIWAKSLMLIRVNFEFSFVEIFPVICNYLSIGRLNTEIILFWSIV